MNNTIGASREQISIEPGVAENLGLSDSDIERAVRLHSESIVVDASRVVKQDSAHFDGARAGGVTAVNHTVTRPAGTLREGLEQINEFRRWMDQNEDASLLALTGDDIRLAKKTGREAIIFGPQDSTFVEDKLSQLGTFYDLGIRIIQITYQRRNWAGDGCGEPNPTGLTAFGRDLVREMEDLGMVVDLSHSSIPTSRQAIEHAKGPCVFTHSAPNAVTPHIRAKDDDTLRALAAKGGVIGLTSVSVFNKLEDGVRPGLKEFLTHVDHLLNVIGPDHLGIGLDITEVNTPPNFEKFKSSFPELGFHEFSFDDTHVENLNHSSELPNITAALVSAGYDDELIQKILGLNFLRVFDSVWK